MTTTDQMRLEKDLRLAALRGFACERGVPEAYAIDIYEREVRTLNANAKVRSFISIIAEKRTKNVLRERAPDEEVRA